MTRLSHVFVSWHAQFYRKFDVFGLKLGSLKWRSFPDLWSRGTKTLCTGLGKVANKSSSHAFIEQHRYKVTAILFVKYFRLTLHIKIDACVDSFKLVLSWTPILSRLIPRRLKAQWVSCTHSLPIFKPHNSWHRITNCTAVECCCCGLSYSLVRRPRNPAWWIYLRLKMTKCIFRCLNFSSIVSNCVAGALVQNKKAFPTFW